jgi:hypothetical protein
MAQFVDVVLKIENMEYNMQCIQEKRLVNMIMKVPLRLFQATF